MGKLIEILFCFIIISVTGAVSLFLCLLTEHKLQIWEFLKDDKENERNNKNNDWRI